MSDKKVINPLHKRLMLRKIGGVTSGAAAGAIAGSLMFPAVGTGIGALIGAFGGSSIFTIDLVSEMAKRKKSHPDETITERFGNLFSEEE